MWGYDPQTRQQHAGYLATARGLRAAGMNLPAARNRARVLAGLPYDVIVADIAERVLRDLAAKSYFGYRG